MYFDNLSQHIAQLDRAISFHEIDVGSIPHCVDLLLFCLSSNMHTQMWRCVPNFVILCAGQFAQNPDVPGYSLNQHWYKIFNTCLPRCPHIVRVLPCNNKYRNRPQKSTEYLVGSLKIQYIYLEDCFSLSRFNSLRHVEIRLTESSVQSDVLPQLNHAMNSLTTLETIGLNLLYGSFSKSKCNNREFINNLPQKVTRLNLTLIEHLPQFEKRFEQLLHFDAPYSLGAEDFCCKMVNLRSLIFFGIPSSFQCFQNMAHLQSLQWIVDLFAVEKWNQFVAAMKGTLLRSLNICNLDCSSSFDNVRKSPASMPLITVTALIFSTSYWTEINIDTIKCLFPQLKHLSINMSRDSEYNITLMRLLAEQAFAADLSSVTIMYRNNNSVTFYKGDKENIVSIN